MMSHNVGLFFFARLLDEILRLHMLSELCAWFLCNTMPCVSFHGCTHIIVPPQVCIFVSYILVSCSLPCSIAMDPKMQSGRYGDGIHNFKLTHRLSSYHCIFFLVSMQQYARMWFTIPLSCCTQERLKARS